MRFGIALKVSAWLSLITLIIGLSFWFSLDRFSGFHQRFLLISEREAPNLIAAAELEQETTRLIALSQDILIPQTRFRFDNVKDLIEQSAHQAQQITTRLDQGELSTRAVKISQYYRLVVASYLDLADLKQLEKEILEYQGIAYRRLAEITLNLNRPATNRNPAQIRWLVGVNSAIGRLFAIRESSHPDLIRDQHQHFARDLELAATELGSLDNDTRRIHQEIHQYGSGELGLFEQLAKLVELGWKIDQHVFDGKHLLNQLLDQSLQLHEQVKESVLSQQAAVNQGIYQFRSVLIGLAIISLLLLVAVQLFVRGSLIRRILNLRHSLITNTQGEPHPVPVIGDDEISDLASEANYFIAEIARRESKLQAAVIRAEAANQAKSQFIANISHDIRTPMNSILNLTSLSLREPLNDRQRGRLEKVERSSGYLMALINEILDFARIESDRLELDCAPFRLDDITSAMEVHADEAERKGLIYRLHVDIDVPAILKGDPLRIRQILHNLISNAIKFTPHGGVQIQVRLLRQENALYWLEFAIKDTGIGIPGDKLELIFDAFSQADSSTTRRFGGSGLGLTICRRLVERMGGQIGVESTPDEGSRFYFSLPLESAEEEDLLPSEETYAADFSAERLGPLEGQLVLLVEDNEFNQTVAIELLERAAIDVDLARDGLEAVELARKADYTLILMDLQMPEMDGYQATRIIRGLPGKAQVPIIALTANAMAETLERCRAAGMNDLITKPISPAQLYQCLLTWLANSRASPPPTPPGTTSSLIDDQVLLSLFVTHYRDIDQKLLHSLQQNDLETAQNYAHNLKAAAATINAPPLTQLASELERLLQQGDQTHAQEQIQPLREQLARVLDQIDTQLSGSVWS